MSRKVRWAGHIAAWERRVVHANIGKKTRKKETSRKT
jgi:hypothetical protein